MNISDIGDPSYICSPQSTIIAAVIVVLLLNFGLVTAFIFFYRMKRKHWVKSTGKHRVKNCLTWRSRQK